MSCLGEFKRGGITMITASGKAVNLMLNQDLFPEDHVFEITEKTLTDLTLKVSFPTAVEE